MGKTYRAWNPRQSWLLPPSPQDWMPEGDLVYFLMDVVETLDISSITAVYEKSDRGFPPFHPRMMLGLLIYSYAMGVRSSRQIAQRCRRDVGWRVIVGEDIPDFRTLSGFRQMHLQAFSALFLEVLRICQAAGLVKLGHLALDGSKVKANASRHKAMSYGRMVAEELRLKGEIAALLQQAESQDAIEDAQP
ncbi:MAG: transposase [Phycisphaerae bacterium]